MTTLTINVTAEDIAEGIRGDCRNCPVAKALKRALPLGSFREVDEMTLTYYKDDTIHFINLPVIVSVFIINFDDMEEVKPFSFELEIPE